MTTSLNQWKLEFPSKEKDLENGLEPPVHPLYRQHRTLL